MSEFVAVAEGQKFAGGTLTAQGAAEVNGSRRKIAEGRADPLSVRLAKAKRGTGKGPLIECLDQELYASDKEIFPGLK